MVEVKWIKLYTDIFNNRKIKQIKKMPEGKSLLIIWLHLLCLAGSTNDNGLVYFSKDIPYTEEMLAVEFEEDVRIVRLALDVFKKFNMIAVVDNFLLVSNWEKYQNVESLERIREQTRKRVAKHRAKQKALVDSSNVTVTLRNAIDKDIDKDIDNIYIDHPKTTDIDLLFDKFWSNYPRKVARAKAYDAFKKLKPTEELVDKMIEALDKYKQLPQWQDKNYIPHPTTWLNQKRWEDEINPDEYKTVKKGFNKKEAVIPEWYGKYKNDLENAPKKEEMSEEEIEKVMSTVDDVFK